MNPRRLLLPVLGAALALTACSSTKNGTPAASPTTTAHPSAASSTAAALAKADFVTQMNALCKSTDDASNAIPGPSGPSDFAAIEAYVPKVLELHSSFATQAAALVARSGDAATLSTNFLQADARETATVLPLLDRLLTAARTKDTATVTTLTDQLGNVNDPHLVAWLNAYGLSDCATLEGN